MNNDATPKKPALNALKKTPGHVAKGVKSTASLFWRGFKAPFGGAAYMLQNPSTLKFAVPPVIIIGALVSTLVYVGLSNAESVLALIWEQPAGESWYIPWLLTPIWYLIWGLTHVVLFAVAVAASIVLSIPLAGPFMEMLSEKVEQIETGYEAPFSWTVTFKNMGVSLAHAGLLALIAGVLGLIAFGLGFIPVIGQVIAVIYSLTVVPMLIGFNPFDYPMTIRLWPLSDKVKFISAQKRLFYGFSLSTYLLMYVPFLNLLMLPACVVAATRLLITMTEDGEVSIRDRRKELLERKRGVSDDKQAQVSRESTLDAQGGVEPTAEKENAAVPEPARVEIS